MNVIRNIADQDPSIWKRAPQAVLRAKPWSRCAWQEQFRRGEPLRDIVVIDAHAHLGNSVRFHINKPEAASMIEVMDRVGVQATMVTANPSLRAEPE